MSTQSQAGPDGGAPGRFAARFGREAEVRYFSPGRVNLLGEHTDYNGGRVLPMAIDRGMGFELAARDDDLIRVHSETFKETVELSAAMVQRVPRKHWSDYLLGVIAAHPAGWPTAGFDLLLTSNLPAGRGLSSSASLSLGFAGVLADQAGRPFDGLELARVAQRAENDFVGLACGLLDPFAVAMGSEGQLIALDCGSLEWSLIPFPADAFGVLLADTGVARNLAGSRYNERRAECERTRDLLGREIVDLKPRDLADNGALAADPVALRRARHVSSENERVRIAVDALATKDFAHFGSLMNESHASLKDDYEVSCLELDVMAELLQGMDGVAGAKMTGAGFGGAVVAVVALDRMASVKAALPAAYAERTGRSADLLEVKPSAGFTRVA